MVYVQLAIIVQQIEVRGRYALVRSKNCVQTSKCKERLLLALHFVEVTDEAGRG